MALIPKRRPRPPAAVVSRLELDERVVAFAPVGTPGQPSDVAADQDAIVATSRGLWWPEAGGPRRIGWHRISKAVWRDGALVVTEADIVDDLLVVDRPAIVAPLAEPRNLPETVRRRVEASVIHSEVAAVEGGSVRFVARKVSGQDGLSWWARLEGGATDSAPLREAVSLRLERLRQVWTPDAD